MRIKYKKLLEVFTQQLIVTLGLSILGAPLASTQEKILQVLNGLATPGNH